MLQSLGKSGMKKSTIEKLKTKIGFQLILTKEYLCLERVPVFSASADYKVLVQLGSNSYIRNEIDSDVLAAAR